MDRQSAWDLVNERCDFALSRHLAHVAVAMEAMAEHLNRPDEKDTWFIAGLLHDIDWNETIKEPEKHCGKETMDDLSRRGVSQDALDAIALHVGGPEIVRTTDIAKALFAVDEISGFCVAAALMRPTKMIGISAKSVMKKMKDKHFAAAVSREDMKSCKAYFDMEPTDLLAIILPRFESIAHLWKLTAEN